MESAPNIVSSIYELRHKFGIIGLTGRTGSGCSTVADLLCKSDFRGIGAPKPYIRQEGVENDERKYRIIHTYLDNVWKEDNIMFIKIKVSVLILFIVIKDGYNNFEKSYKTSLSDKSSGADRGAGHFPFTAKLLKNLKIEFNKMHKKAERYYNIILKDDNAFSNISKEIIDFIDNDIPVFFDKFIKESKILSIKKLHRPFQFWGNNIRKYGVSYCPESACMQNNPSLLAEIINKIIKIKRDLYSDKGTFFIIDSLRNPFEILFFRERYTSFYLMSINIGEDERRKNLDKADYSKSDVDDLDAKEHPEKRKGIIDSYYTQDIESCIGLSDIHISHSNEKITLNFELKRQLCHYIALMLHPGLVPPSPEERIMQIAITAKLNSGCISRQVGAVVTNESYSVKAIGWNTVPEGQTPCLLRDFNDLCNNSDISAYSSFELTDNGFRKIISDYKKQCEECGSDKLKNVYGLSQPFCFKDLYNCQTEQKNQVYTRSLHAEENAFLQLSKYGSGGIIGGKLFTTASCCELCAKKAYQLGIRDIFYIDSYPGISLNHIFMAGIKRPSVHLFKGAVGRAYQQLYTPLVPLKDEIEFLIGISGKDFNKEKTDNKNNDE